MKQNKKRKDESKDIALERIDVLFLEAVKNKEKADRYVQMARKLAMKYKVKLKPEYKKSYCNYCNSYFTPSNSRIRFRDGKRIAYCLKCRKFNRTKLKK
jgi:ribonuclease P protein subunit RPR2